MSSEINEVVSPPVRKRRRAPIILGMLLVFSLTGFVLVSAALAQRKLQAERQRTMAQRDQLAKQGEVNRLAQAQEFDFSSADNAVASQRTDLGRVVPATPDFQATEAAPVTVREYRVPRTVTEYVADRDNPGQFRAQTTTVWETVRRAEPNATYRSSAEDRDVAALVADLQRGGERDPEKIKQLKSLLTKQFTEMHQSQAKRLEQVERQLETVRNALDERSRRQDEIVERRINQLLGESDPLNWNYSPSLPHDTVREGWIESSPRAGAAGAYPPNRPLPPPQFDSADNLNFGSAQLDDSTSYQPSDLSDATTLSPAAQVPETPTVDRTYEANEPYQLEQLPEISDTPSSLPQDGSSFRPNVSESNPRSNNRVATATAAEPDSAQAFGDYRPPLNASSPELPGTAELPSTADVPDAAGVSDTAELASTADVPDTAVYQGFEPTVATRQDPPTPEIRQPHSSNEPSQARVQVEEASVDAVQNSVGALPGIRPSLSRNSGVSASETVSIGYRLRGHLQTFEQLDGLAREGLASKAELRKVTNQIQEAKAQWTFRIRELENRRDVAELDVKIATEQLAAAESELEQLQNRGEYSALWDVRQALLEGKRQLQLARIELTLLHEQQEWSTDFGKSLERFAGFGLDEQSTDQVAPADDSGIRDTPVFNDDSASAESVISDAADALPTSLPNIQEADDESAIEQDATFTPIDQPDLDNEEDPTDETATSESDISST